ncbi:MAG TPA: DUF3300 domain-containing protein [Acidobacteriaceae bacterium]
MSIWKRLQAYIAGVALVVATAPIDGCKRSETNPAPTQASESVAPPVINAMPTAEELYQLVAPIALFPDNLVALVLAGSTYPDQITAAQSWLQQNGKLDGPQLQQAVDQQPWDGSVKGLTTFPDVLDQMAKNLSWTSELGDAYFNDQQNVMNAVQVMRQRAQAAGTLKSSSQQSVSVQPTPPPPAEPASGQPTTIVQPPAQTIVIQPAQPNVVYVPTYNPAVVYGAPVPVYPGYVAPPPPPGPSTGEMVATSLLSFGVGVAVGAAINNNNNCCGWGYNSWGTNWHGGTVVYNRNVYVSNSNAFVNRNAYYNNRNNYYNNNNYPRPVPYNGNNVASNNRSVNYNQVNVNQANINQAAQNRPNFNSNLNQQQYKGTTLNQQGRPVPAAAVNNRQPMQANQGAQNSTRLNNNNARPAATQPNFANQQGQGGNRPGVNQAANDRQNAQTMQTRAAAPNVTQNNLAQRNIAQNNVAQNNPARGFGQQPSRGASSGAFQNVNTGGNARLDSARGQQSLGVTRPTGDTGNLGANRQVNAGAQRERVAQRSTPGGRQRR